MRHNNRLAVSFLALVTLALMYNNCAGAPESKNAIEGIVGNPETGSNQVLSSLCNTIHRCNSFASIESCETGVLKSSINSQVGAPTTFSTFSLVAQAELVGGLAANNSALETCTRSIENLSCDDPLVLGSYTPALDNPFSGASNVIPYTGSCSEVFVPTKSLIATNYHYVRAGASGSADGSDWLNACPDFTGPCRGDRLKRGDTYFVASGNYSEVAFETPGAEPITVKKATAADHGTEQGWSSAFATGPASFPAWSFGSSHWIVDGNGRSSLRSGHGFKIDLPGLGSGCSRTFCNAIFINRDSDIDSITIRFTEIVGFGTSRDLTAIYSAPGAGISSNITFTSGYIHDFGIGERGLLVSGSGILAWTFENSVMARIKGLAVDDQGSTNITVRNNIFEDIAATAVIVSDNGGTTLTTKNMAIYGNVFWQSNPSIYGTSNGVIACNDGNVCLNWKISNNTIANFASPGSLSGRIRFDQAGSLSSGNVIINNIWYNSVNVSTSGTASFDYNAYFSSTGFPSEAHGQSGNLNPFVNASIGDFHLTAPTISGLPLALPFNFDMNQILRGGNGVWDRGALEF